MKWIDIIVEAFQALNGSASLQDLYTYIEKNPKRKLTKSYQATIRKEIETHSSESKNYNKNNPDLFANVGHGKWKLR